MLKGIYARANSDVITLHLLPLSQSEAVLSVPSNFIGARRLCSVGGDAVYSTGEGIRLIILVMHFISEHLIAVGLLVFPTVGLLLKNHITSSVSQGLPD